MGEEHRRETEEISWGRVQMGEPDCEVIPRDWYRNSEGIWQKVHASVHQTIDRTSC